MKHEKNSSLNDACSAQQNALGPREVCSPESWTVQLAELFPGSGSLRLHRVRIFGVWASLVLEQEIVYTMSVKLLGHQP